MGCGVERFCEAAKIWNSSGFFSRRDPETIAPRTGVPAYPMEKSRYAGSNRRDDPVRRQPSDLPEQTPMLARQLTWWIALTPMRESSIFPVWMQPAGGAVSVISAGWIWACFPLNRLLGQAILPDGAITPLGKGRQPGTFRRHPQNPRCKGRPASTPFR